MSKIPKKYMLILQRKYGGQEAVEFNPNGEAITAPIRHFSDEKLSFEKQKEKKVQKNTLAFFDAITNKFENFHHFLSVIGENIYPNNYKPTSSYIGFLNNGYMQRLSISFDDALLAEIARKTKGNNINKQDKDTINIISDIFDKIEDPTSDFVTHLKETIIMGDDRYNLSRTFVEDIVNYHNIQRVIARNEQRNYIINAQLKEDAIAYKKIVLEKIQSYRNFRELYRFMKQYIYDKNYQETLKTIESNSSQQSPKEEQHKPKEECSRQKKKTLDYDIPGQMKLSDLF